MKFWKYSDTILKSLFINLSLIVKEYCEAILNLAKMLLTWACKNFQNYSDKLIFNNSQRSLWGWGRSTVLGFNFVPILTRTSLFSF